MRKTKINLIILICIILLVIGVILGVSLFRNNKETIEDTNIIDNGENIVSTEDDMAKVEIQVASEQIDKIVYEKNIKGEKEISGAIVKSATVKFWGISNEQIIWEYETEEYILGSQMLAFQYITIVEQNMFIQVNGKILIVDVGTGKVINTISNHEYYDIYVLSIDSNFNVYLISRSNGNMAMDEYLTIINKSAQVENEININSDINSNNFYVIESIDSDNVRVVLNVPDGTREKNINIQDLLNKSFSIVNLFNN